MAKEWSCYCTEKLRREVGVEGETQLEALEKLEKLYNDGKIILDYNDLVDTQFTDCQYSREEIEILDEIVNYCESECPNTLNCKENKCVLFRIEKIITGE